MKVKEIVAEGFWSDAATALFSKEKPKADITSADIDKQWYNNWENHTKQLVQAGILDPADPNYAINYANELNKFLSRGVDPRISSMFPPPGPTELTTEAGVASYIAKVSAFLRIKKPELANAPPAPAKQDTWDPTSPSATTGVLTLANGNKYIRPNTGDTRWFRADSSGVKKVPEEEIRGQNRNLLNQKLKAVLRREFE